MICGNCCLSHTPYLGKLSHGKITIYSGLLEPVEWIDSSSSWLSIVEKRLCLGEVALVEFTWCLEWLEGVSALGGGVTWCCEVDGDLVSLGNLAVVHEGDLDDLELELIFLEKGCYVTKWSLEKYFGVWPNTLASDFLISPVLIYSISLSAPSFTQDLTAYHRTGHQITVVGVRTLFGQKGLTFSSFTQS